MAGSRKKKRTGIKIFFILVLIIAAAGLWVVFGPNTGSLKKGEYLYIRTGSTYADVIKLLDEGGYVRQMTSFKLLAGRANYPDKVKAGKYRIKAGMSNYNIIRMLRNGTQEPVKLVINKLRTEQDLVTFISTQLEADSNEVRRLMHDSAFLAEYELNSNTAMALIIPDTYEFFWNTSAEKTLRKIGKNYKRFWNGERKKLASSKKLTPAEVITMAAIVEEETNKTADKGPITSVYINRIAKGMPLQADPTVKFAVGDFSIRRVTGVHLAKDSPYNTYLHKGLPPGPICTPSQATVNAVLNAPTTDYLYFCAAPALDGSSLFAATYEEHMKNARAYQQALNERNIH